VIKVRSLEVNNFRGIRSFNFELNERNFVVAGRNGTGKSGLVDALEFAITGDISRLTGKGTAGISVKSHGAHVDYASKLVHAWVKINFVVLASGQEYVLKRTVSNPKKFTISPDVDEGKAAIEWMKKHPEFALTRREIVRFVLAEGKSRGDDVAQLLGLERLTSARALLQKIKNADLKEHAREDQLLDSRVAVMTRTYGLPNVDAQVLLEKCNEFRVGLGQEKAHDLKAEALVADLEYGHTVSALSANRADWIERLHKSLGQVDGAIGGDLEQQIQQLIARLEEKVGDKSFEESLSADGLLSAALKQFDGDFCPVCGTDWRDGDFLQVISHKRYEAEAARNELGELAAVGRDLALMLGPVYEALSVGAYVEQGLLISADERIHASLAESTLHLQSMLANMTSTDDFVKLIRASPLKLAKCRIGMIELRKRVHALPEPSSQDKMLAELRALSNDIGQLQEAQSRVGIAKARSDQSSVVFQIYDTSTQASLLGIYLDVQDTFAEFYAILNSDDESAFTASLVPDGPSLDMTVDFYTRGLHPPGAYHSEGHQDAMGLCLYLALASHTLGTHFSLSALDDVLMSIDSGHRRAVVALMLDKFPHTQFIVTTHDEQWMRQMKMQGFAKSSEILQFRRWTVDEGPVDWRHYEPWTEVHRFLSAGEVKAAAGALRSYLEYYSRELADGVRASVPYRLDGHNTLGELMDSSIKQLRGWIKKGKAAANSWGDRTLVIDLDKRDASVQAAATKAKQEEWAINTVIHFNEWENLGAGEFAYVVEAWRELLACFECGTCSGVLGLVDQSGRPSALRCSCSAQTINLVIKS
jgi:recombinational DNA repair ATPase RecF